MEQKENLESVPKDIDNNSVDRFLYEANLELGIRFGVMERHRSLVPGSPFERSDPNEINAFRRIRRGFEFPQLKDLDSGFIMYLSVIHRLSQIRFSPSLALFKFTPW